ncbi:type IX secretion system sortase PorU [Geojedonia litorea]|uniref:Type IX secretion system sortase PorU n=1 Tax=Geojedonia litorea TaxID=1268269 RepID=A0ABV9N353_9FLAO
MKKLLLAILFLSFMFGYSQQKQFEITWNGTLFLETSSSKIEVPAFNSQNFSYDDERGLTYFALWDINGLVNEKSLQVTNIAYQTISRTDLKDLPVNILPSKPQYQLNNSVDRTNRSAYFEISPIINDNGVIKKITSFNISYSSGTNANRGFGPAGISNSVLSAGSWYKFYVDKTGVFRLSKSFLSQLGVNVNTVDPRTIKIYGNGGAMLPHPNSVPYPLDLTENAIKFVGESDGNFGNDDYILFYAEGPTGYNAESNTNINAYTDKSYYFVNVSSGQGKRIQPMNQPSSSPNLTINTFQDYQFYEVDETNLVKLGRRWFGDRFDIENEREYKFSFPNLVTAQQARVKVYAAAISDVATSMDINLNGNTISSLNFNAVSGTTLASANAYNSTVNLSSAEISLRLKYNNNGNPSSLGYLDYISIEATRALTFDGDQLAFKNSSVASSSGTVEYTLSNATSVLEVWDITDKYNITTAPNTNKDANFSFKANAGTLRAYLAFTAIDYFEPLRDSNVSVNNQNIKGTIFLNNQGEFQDIDYLIVSPNNLVSQAERLAEINRNQYGLNVKVVTLNEIYTEFSSGNQDIAAIRNMVKYVYDNASAPDKRVKYLCLFGDASFDYKDRIPNNTNIVPSWLSIESFNLTSSFVSDDFYGMMDANEGGMQTSDRLDIAVGRMLVENPQRAKDMVDKIKSYYEKEAYGSWRNNVVVISDDVDQDWEKILQNTTNDIGNDITQQKPFLNVIKIHSDAFQQESSASGSRYPQVNKEIKDAIEVGALVVNYFGHGGEDGIASERIFDKNDSQEVRNLCKFNCFVTVTCEYTKFDDPTRPTAGEYTFWNKNGGSIGLLTTTRQIFVTTGVSFNVVLEKYLFAFGSNNYPSMAEALRLTKNDNSIAGNGQKRLVFFIGDPAMKLAFAKPSINLTHVNDVAIGQGTDVLQALGRVKMSGEIVDESGNLLTNYNGILTATIFDKDIDRKTLGNDGTRENGQLIQLDFKTLGEVIFKGQATVTNGLFEFNFVVPRDIGIPVGNGKASFYAQSDSPLQDQAGASFDIQVGGINDKAAEDNTGPIINLYMNDENFVSGGITNEAPTLLAKLQDENGINTASGIGHDIVAIIDGDETNPFVLNDYYQAEVDDYQNGKVTYPFRDLEPGLHTLTLKAWDVYNNSSTAEIQFIVHDQNEELVINNVLNYPNPFIDYTEFWFNHNSSDVLDVSIQIFTVSGKLVRTLNGQTSGGSKTTSSLSKDIIWDGRDDFGDKIGKGVYIYKLKVRSNQLNKQVEKIQKLVIL